MAGEKHISGDRVSVDRVSVDRASEDAKVSASGTAAPNTTAANASMERAFFPENPSSIRRTIRFTPEGLDRLLSGKGGPLLADTQADTYPSADAEISGIHKHRHPHSSNHSADDVQIEAGDLTDETRIVGRDLAGKQPPAHPLDAPGANPFGHRQFLGHEFPGMLSFDPDGKPTFLSRFPEAKSLNDIKEIRINIATKLPEYMKGNTSQATETQAMEEEAFDGKTLEEAFTPIDQKTMLAATKKYAQEFEAAYGIKLNFGFDLPDPHLSLMGYTSGNEGLLGFASFPPAINRWPRWEGLGDHPGYMLLNHSYLTNASSKEAYDLFVHEFGHTLGLLHPHDDVAILQMSKHEQLTATKMAYTDLVLRAFEHEVQDGDGTPVLKHGKPQTYTAGPDEGVLDFGFRKWLAEPPVIGHVSNPDPASPECDLYKNNFNLDFHFRHALVENADSHVFRLEKLLPIVPMLNDGKHTVLRGTAEGNDLLDTNPGYSSIVRDAALGVEQRFNLVEGHFEKVLGIAGNNIIIAAGAGAQEIHPGSGASEVHFVYPEFTGDKRVISESGKDSLILTEEVMQKNGFHAAEGKDGNIVLQGKHASISLEGKSIAHIVVVDQHGQQLSSLDSAKLNADQLNAKLFDAKTWKQDKAEQKPQNPQAKFSARLMGQMAEKEGNWQQKIASQPTSLSMGNIR